jgi:hypothetical protein
MSQDAPETGSAGGTLSFPARWRPGSTACPINYPTRMRSLGTGWTDGVGHLGAWGGVLIAGALFVATNPRNFVIFITIPCALVPGLLVAFFGNSQRRRTLEELAH